MYVVHYIDYTHKHISIDHIVHNGVHILKLIAPFCILPVRLQKSYFILFFVTFDVLLFFKVSLSGQQTRMDTFCKVDDVCLTLKKN